MIRREQSDNSAIKLIENIKSLQTIEVALYTVRIIDEVYEKIDEDFEKLFDVIEYTQDKESIVILIKQMHNLYKITKELE